MAGRNTMDSDTDRWTLTPQQEAAVNLLAVAFVADVVSAIGGGPH